MRSSRLFQIIIAWILLLVIALGTGLACDRDREGEGIQVSLRRISSGKEIQFRSAGLLFTEYLEDLSSSEWMGVGFAIYGEEAQYIPVTDFAFIVDFNSPIWAGDEENTIVFYHQFFKEWKEPANVTVEVYAMHRSHWPKIDSAYKVAIETQIVEEDCIMVSPVEGSFPSDSHIVLHLDFGEFEDPRNMATAHVHRVEKATT